MGSQVVAPKVFFPEVESRRVPASVGVLSPLSVEIGGLDFLEGKGAGAVRRQLFSNKKNKERHYETTITHHDSGLRGGHSARSAGTKLIRGWIIQRSLFEQRQQFKHTQSEQLKRTIILERSSSERHRAHA